MEVKGWAYRVPGGQEVGLRGPRGSGGGLAGGLSSRKFHTSGSGSVTSSESPGIQSETGDNSDNKSGKLDTLHNIRCSY